MRIERRRSASASLASPLIILTFGLAPASTQRTTLIRSSLRTGRPISRTSTRSHAEPQRDRLHRRRQPRSRRPAHSGTTFGSGVDYLIKVDTNGDLKPDINYKYTSATQRNGRPEHEVWRNGTLVSKGWTGRTTP